MPHSTSPARSTEPLRDPSVAVPPPTILREIRTGKLKLYDDLTIPTGIYKDIRSGVLHIDKVGLPEDEHDLTFHGGPDKAVHQYSKDHYQNWKSLYPDHEVSSKFVPGGFGENLVASGWNERNVCIGDKVRIGYPEGRDDEVGGHHGALLEVSIPRQPCFKLNQKFGIKNFAPKTHERAWTGWYYRVLEEGDVKTGMELRIIDRPNDRWTIERMHHYIHREKNNRAVMEELCNVKEMGMECKRPFLTRMKAIKEAEEGGTTGKQPEVFKKYTVAEIKDENPRIKSLVFELTESAEDSESVDIDAGSHIRLKLPNGLIRPYSVVSGSTSRFILGIALESESRGGSAYIHHKLKVNDIVEVGKATESVDINGQASHHIIIAGGIGITAFLDVMTIMDKIAFNYEFHYAIRGTNDVPFQEVLESKMKRTTIYDASQGQRMDIESILKNRKWNSHVYVCGPTRMSDAVAEAAKKIGMTEEEIHYEAFTALTEGDPFEAEVEVDGEKKLLRVEEKQTLLQVMREAGLEMSSSCEVGNCKTCVVRVKCGDVDHRGAKVREGEMLSCVSRGKGRIEVEVVDGEE